MDDLLEKCIHVNLMKFNKAKWKLLHLGQGNLWCQYMLGGERIESNPAEEGWGYCWMKS